MPNHSPEHMRRLSGVSASRRRADKIARLIESAPPIEADQVTYLCALLNARVAVGGVR